MLVWMIILIMDAKIGYYDYISKKTVAFLTKVTVFM